MRTLVTAGCLAAAVVLAGCSSSGSGGASAPPTSSAKSSVATQPAAATKADITIKNFGFSGKLTVTPGEKVTVLNMDSVAHTLTDKKTKKFDTGNIAGSGGTGTFTAPDKAGKYPFGCTYHPEMAGTLVVRG